MKPPSPAPYAENEMCLTWLGTEEGLKGEDASTLLRDSDHASEKAGRCL